MILACFVNDQNFQKTVWGKGKIKFDLVVNGDRNKFSDNLGMSNYYFHT